MVLRVPNHPHHGRPGLRTGHPPARPECGDPSKKVFPWDLTEVWYATSKNGYHWTERGRAVGRGPQGAFDDRSVFTPEILAHDGHEVCVWKYRGGIAALLTTDGPEKNTIQFAPDGINFEIEAVIKNPPQALGPFRTPDHDKGPLEGIRWGLCHTFSGGPQGRWAYIQRFHVDETLKNWFLNKATYE